MVQYKSSIFNLEKVCIFRGKPHRAIYNTLTGSLVLLPENDIRELATNKGEKSELLKELVEMDLWVEENTDEFQVYQHWYQQQIHDGRSVGSKMLVTGECNNRCRYCIIEKNSISMDRETADRINDFYFQHIEEISPVEVADDYSGGEPWLKHSLIVEIAEKRKTFCEKRGIQYSFQVTTNGTLISSSSVEKLKRVGLNRLRVSFAGPADLHDYLRPGRNGQGTYDVIVNNLKEVSGKISIGIECQYDGLDDSYLRASEMLDDFIDKDILIDDVQFTPILAQRHSDEFRGGLDNPEKQVWLQHEAVKRNLSDSIVPPVNTCLAELKHRFVFDAAGFVLPCPSLQPGEMAYGDVVAGIDFYREAVMCNRLLPEKCRQCSLLPLCKGGCRNQALIEHGDFAGVDCRYDQILFYSMSYIDEEIKKAGGSVIG